MDDSGDKFLPHLSYGEPFPHVNLSWGESLQVSICHVVPVANIKYAIPFNGDSALENHQKFAITKAQCKISAYSLFLFGLCNTKAAAVVNLHQCFQNVFSNALA